MYEKQGGKNEMLNINILMVILGAVLAVIGLVGIIRKKEYYLIPFQMGFYMMGFFGARFLILAGYISWWL